jgi:hypothetical protein
MLIELFALLTLSSSVLSYYLTVFVLLSICFSLMLLPMDTRCGAPSLLLSRATHIVAPGPHPLTVLRAVQRLRRSLTKALAAVAVVMAVGVVPVVDRLLRRNMTPCLR